MAKKTGKFLVGALETCDLPDLGITNMPVRVDTGATTSSLHVDNIEEFEMDGKNWIRFQIHPDVHNVDKIVTTTARLSSKKTVKSSSADKERRAVIKTRFSLGGQTWRIRLTLTNRSSMSYLMLLGREAMKDRIIVDPSFEYLASDST